MTHLPPPDHHDGDHPDARPDARRDERFDGIHDGALDDAFDDALDDAEADDPTLDEEFPLEDGVADLVAVVHCPYCGEPNELAIDPGGGERQSYVEDCQVCCRPWEVRVTYHADGSADVHVDAADGE